MKFIVLIAFIALVYGESLVMKEAGSYDIEVPKNGNYSLSFVFTAAAAANATGGPDIGIHIHFRTTSVQREITVWVGENETSMTSYLFSTDGDHIFSLAGFRGGCATGCTVNILLGATCDYMSCVNSISTRIWAREVHRSTQQYVYGNKVRPYMPIYTDKWSPDVVVKQGEYMYFEYVAAADGQLRAEKDSTVGSSLLLLSGGNTNDAPTQKNSPKWVQLEDSQMEDFLAGINFIGLYGGDTMAVVSTEGSVCIGTCTHDGAASLVPAFFLLIATIIALF